jgi:pimeloyl-ACP methyl ester carboxylesterase
MEPRIQYAQTKDGLSIAFYTLGEGMPLVVMPNAPFSHIQLQRQIPEWQREDERLAERRMLVRYDGRGNGLSDRNVGDFSLAAQVLDLEAVVDRLGLERFALYTPLHSGPAGIAYAARHPERVSHLVLWCSWARGSDFRRSPRSRAFRAIRETDWDLYVESMADLILGRRASQEESRWWAAFIRECATPEVQGAALRAADGFDVTGLLPQLGTLTLVLHRRNHPFLDVGVARGLASQIPDARLALLEGTSPMPFLNDMEAVLAAIDEFLGVGEEAAAGAPAPAPSPSPAWTAARTATLTPSSPPGTGRWPAALSPSPPSGGGQWSGRPARRQAGLVQDLPLLLLPDHPVPLP